MLKKYPIVPGTDVKTSPSASTINAILNYSRSIEVKKSKKDVVLIHLN